MNQKPVAVLGAGSWGTALAMVLARSGREVRLIARQPEAAKSMESSRQNVRYLPDFIFPESLHVTADLQQALNGIHACVIALPFAAVADYLPRLKKDAYPVIAACKGLDPETLMRTDQLLSSQLEKHRIAILSGPSFAQEVAHGQPTAITMAAASVSLAAEAASFFNDTSFRIYFSDDLVGVALGGALKNVVAIAAGIAEGLGLGHNTNAAIVTRGLNEMARLSKAQGGRQETMMGLAGLGDLVLTCTGGLSRNRRLGMALAEGMDTQAAIASIGQVVEGVRTADAVVRMARQCHLEVPLMQAVHSVLHRKLDIPSAVSMLLKRPEHKEFE